MKAFTLLELVVVMGIIAVIAGLSVLGIVRYKSTVEMNTGYTEIVNALKTQRNKAVNSAAYNPPGEGDSFVAPSFYAVRFFDGAFGYSICNFSGLGSLVICEEDKSSTVNLPYGVGFASNCPGIGFRVIESDIVKIPTEAFATYGAVESAPTPPECEITISHIQTTLTRSIRINLRNDTLNL